MPDDAEDYYDPEEEIEPLDLDARDPYPSDPDELKDFFWGKFAALSAELVKAKRQAKEGTHTEFRVRAVRNALGGWIANLYQIGEKPIHPDFP
jgi:hypothetical protein